ncbi:hypothetical protein COO60DRAFT_1634484 [Scenedesmus sp. NREL 46B-D3]|nr:hypothetical protein COO60DRAFT_1634484 [Scenedesmus sp. NREL 46B-D3]
MEARDPSKLNVHLVPHTHDDSGWLKTFEQYYWGTRQDIQMAGVQYVLSTVVQALLDNTDRKFSYAEMSFFTRWWHLQPRRVHEQVRQLVASGQLDFVNGGFVQHDEAAAHYAAMIDQTTRGHRFLNSTFGFVPKVAWQIDPFGHSATQAALLSAAAGYEALFFGRADYQDMKLRQVFSHNYPSGNYGPPGGFNFDWGQLDPPIVDDPASPEYNLQQRVDLFVAQALAWSKSMRGNDVLFMMGSDFEYANAHAIFANLDKLIHHVNVDGRVNVFYSTPAADAGSGSSACSSSSRPGLDALEFAVSISQHHDAVTGTEKQAVANDYARYLYLGMEQAAEVVNAALQQLLTSNIAPATLAAPRAAAGTPTGRSSSSSSSSGSGSDSSQLAGSSSTSRSSSTWAGLRGHISEDDNSSSSSSSGAAQGGLLVVAYNSLAWPRREWVRVPVAAGHAAPYTVQDADGRRLPSQLLPVAVSTLQLQQGLQTAGLAGDPAAAAAEELVFEAALPPVGYASFVVQLSSSSSSTMQGIPAATSSPQQLHHVHTGVADTAAIADSTPAEAPAAAAPQLERSGDSSSSTAAAAPGQQPRQLTNGRLNLTIDAASGRFFSVSSADGSWGLRFSQELMWYQSSTGEEDGQAGGAYIFRPAQDAPVAQPLAPGGAPLNVTIEAGPLLTEVRQSWAPWASLITRLWAGADWLEQEWTVGPVPADGVGKEIIVRASTDLQSGGFLFTDSNGREMLTRRLNHRASWPLQVNEPAAGNYYPITAAAAVSDGCVGLGLATDRAQGAASLGDGQLEVMLHRLTAVDDARGVGEPLNETLCGTPPGSCPAGGLPARGRHLLVLGPMGEQPAAQHPTAAAAAAAAAGSAGSSGISAGAAGVHGSSGAAGASVQHDESWQGVPRMLRQAQQLLNDPVLLAFARLPAAAVSPSPQQQHDAAGTDASAPAAGVISSLGLTGRWSGLAATTAAAAAAAAAVGDVDEVDGLGGVEGLPANVHLLTLMRAGEGDPSRLIIRLAHKFQANPVDSIVQAVTNAVNATTSGVVIAYDRVDNFTRDAVNATRNAGATAVDATRDAGASAFNATSSFANGVGRTVTNATNAAANDIAARTSGATSVTAAAAVAGAAVLGSAMLLLL